MNWDKGVVSTDMDELRELEEVLRDKARAVRECPLCDSGYISVDKRDVFSAVRRCSCFMSWQAAGRALNEEIRKYEKRTKGTYSRWDSSMADITKRDRGPELQPNEVAVLCQGLWRIMDSKVPVEEVIADVEAEMAKREVVQHEARF